MRTLPLPALLLLAAGCAPAAAPPVVPSAVAPSALAPSAPATQAASTTVPAPTAAAAAPGAAPGEAAACPLVTPTAHDGRHDFDALHGTWRTHYKLLRKRLANDHEWYACEGTSAIRPFWAGQGNLEDGDVHCPDRVIGGMTLRTYDAATHQWSLWWGTRKLGVVPPQQVGHFDGKGTGEFFANDVWEGKPIIVRFKWTMDREHPQFEQAFSTDGGATWEPNWTTVYDRVPESTPGTWNAKE
jgi:hypothetical protein